MLINRLTFILIFFTPIFLSAQNIVKSYEPDRLECETIKTKILPDGNIVFFINCYHDDFFHEPYGFYEVRTPEDELLFRKNIFPSTQVEILVTEEDSVYFISQNYECGFSSLVLIKKLIDNYDLEGIAFASNINEINFNSGILDNGNIWIVGTVIEIFSPTGEDISQHILFYPRSCLLSDSLLVSVTFENEIEFSNINTYEVLETIENVPSDIEEIKLVSQEDSIFLIKTPTLVQLYKNTEQLGEISFSTTDDFVYRIEEGSVLYSTDLGESLRQVSRMDLEGNFVDLAVVEVPVGSDFLDFDINDNLFVAAEAEIIAPETAYGGQKVALRQIQNLSLDENFSTQDIGVTDIVLPDPVPVIEISDGGFFGGWEYAFHTITVTVQNFGNTSVDSFQLRSFTPEPFSYCDGKQFITENVELTEPLLPNTSIDIEIEEKYLTFPTMSGAELCVWTARPNGETDGNSFNDTYCTFINDDSLPTNDFMLDESSVRLSPNPTKDVLTIETIYEFDTYQISNQTGQIIKEGAFLNNSNILTTDFPKGIYFLTLYGKTGVAIQKFIRL